MKSPKEIEQFTAFMCQQCIEANPGSEKDSLLALHKLMMGKKCKLPLSAKTIVGAAITKKIMSLPDDK